MPTPTDPALDEVAWPRWPAGWSGWSASTIDLIRIPLPTDGAIVPATVGELSPDEVVRAERYLVEPPRRQFVTTRRALRRLCGAILSLDPREVLIEFTQFGKPAIAAAQNPHGLAFNVSHSGAWAAIAIGWQRRIGVDLEAVKPQLNWRGLAGRFFAEGEQQQLAELPEPLQPHGFYRVWTGKEAYMKATGLGMSFSLKDFTVAADPRVTPQVLDVVGQPEEAARWHGAAFAPAADVFGTLLWDNGPAEVRQWTWSTDS
ncbi:MAG: 4'-phosphopantetheinyl transferase superfamily protein [Planctomycetaceae bacterium]|nr:4'-phosphopantetheinyl transferase superfamily protein [Planctomycetaceae bacterium]